MEVKRIKSNLYCNLGFNTVILIFFGIEYYKYKDLLTNQGNVMYNIWVLVNLGLYVV